jgi:hypothetical protein
MDIMSGLLKELKKKGGLEEGGFQRTPRELAVSLPEGGWMSHRGGGRCPKKL